MSTLKFFSSPNGLKEFYYHPVHILVNLLFVALVAFFLNAVNKKRQKKKKTNPLTKTNLPDDVVEKRIKAWKPKPLMPEKTELDQVKIDILTKRQKRLMDSAVGTRVKLAGSEKQYLNFGTQDFLGMSENQKIIDTCKETILKYGVGACGPRGFYGTMDVHLEMEDEFARFFGAEMCLSYSFGYLTLTSVIPSLITSGDLVFADENVNYGIQTGLELSRCEVQFFKHNNLASLEDLLKKDRDATVGTKKSTEERRKFVIVEGVYAAVGDLSPLKKVVELCKKYCVRICVDDSLGIGVLGATGKGSIEHHNIPIDDIDMLCGTFEASFGTAGGFCLGKRWIIEHQRMNAAGYVFSASTPIYLVQAATEGLRCMKNNPELLKKLQNNIKILQKALKDTLAPLEAKGVVEVKCCPNSPVSFVYLKKNETSLPYPKQLLEIERVSDELLEKGMIISAPQYQQDEYQLPRPSLRLFVTANHTEEEIKLLCKEISAAVSK